MAARAGSGPAAFPPHPRRSPGIGGAVAAITAQLRYGGSRLLGGGGQTQLSPRCPGALLARVLLSVDVNVTAY